MSIGYDPNNLVPFNERHVHYCEPEMGHRLHQRIRVGRVAGWYVFEREGCLLRTYGPFATRAEAERGEDIR
jgi:hypothetical protein